MAMTLYEPAFSLVIHRFPTRYRGAITWLTLLDGFASTLSLPACVWLIGAAQVAGRLVCASLGRSHVGRIGGALSAVGLMAAPSPRWPPRGCCGRCRGTANWWRCWPLSPRVHGWRFWRRWRHRARGVARG